MAPKFVEGENPDSIVAPETYLAIARLREGDFLVIIPSIDGSVSFTLEGSRSIHANDPDQCLALVGYDSLPSQNGIKSAKRAALISCGPYLYPLLEDAIRRLRNSISGIDSVEQETFDRNIMGRRFSSNRGPGPSFVDSFGWCTWDSFYTDLSPNRILRGLKSFHDKGIYPRFMLLDDGWQDTDVNDRANCFQWAGRLVSFDANYKFSSTTESIADNRAASHRPSNPIMATQDVLSLDDIKGCLNSRFRDEYLKLVKAGGILSSSKNADIRARHSLKDLIGTVKGYWNGVTTQLESNDNDYPCIMEKFQPSLVWPEFPSSLLRMSKKGNLSKQPFAMNGLGLVNPALAGEFYLSYHRNLAAMGVDGVKVDVQSSLPLLKHADYNGWDLVSTFHRGLKYSVDTVFGESSLNPATGESKNAMIVHCMCHSQHTFLAILTQHPYQCDLSTDFEAHCVPVVRGSDDFWPEQTASHTPHLVANAYNALLLSFIGLQDWDMFQSSLGAPSAMHAAARAISGGPIYVSDRPDEQDDAILKRVVLPNGRLLRCLRNARPVASNVLNNPQTSFNVPLLLQNINPCGGLVIAAFHVFGSVLENDKDRCRYISPNEAQWSSRQKHNPQLVCDGVPWFRNLHSTGDLDIFVSIKATDVEEIERELTSFVGDIYQLSDATVVSTREYALHRFSDHHVEMVDVQSPFPIHLSEPYDFDVVSFAAKYKPISGNEWIAAIGAVDMYNSGGAVCSVSFQSSHDKMKLAAFVQLKGIDTRHWIILSHSLTTPPEVFLVYDEKHADPFACPNVPKEHSWLTISSSIVSEETNWRVLEIIVQPHAHLAEDIVRSRILASTSFTVGIELR
eukprot:scaffold1882_cov163-Ochromonas_danica.AAC.8